MHKRKNKQLLFLLVVCALFLPHTQALLSVKGEILSTPEPAVSEPTTPAETAAPVPEPTPEPTPVPTAEPTAEPTVETDSRTDSRADSRTNARANAYPRTGADIRADAGAYDRADA